ncbi:MAG TPA: aldolase/citrate lyase family protein [Thermoanaerobaculia bacterium]|nr:aldolase/citrate lyase family protein [Thermoanaerobaculia bacterium]
MTPDPLNEKLKSREAVHGLLSPDADPALVEALGLLGFDLYILDTEHGTAGPREAEGVVRACEVVGMAPLVRPRSLDPKLILQFLDAGMAGVMLPGVRSADDVRELVAAVKYPPVGRRGIAPVRANRWLLASQSQDAWVARSNVETLVLPQVETREALERVDELAAVPGLDGFIVGPRDLSMALGYTDGPSHPEVEQAIDRVAAVARAHGLVAGTVAPSGARARELVRRGLTILLHSVTALLRNGAAAYFAELEAP